MPKFMSNTSDQNRWRSDIEREQKLRLNWFIKNELAIQELCKQKPSAVDENLLKDWLEIKKQMVANNIRQTVPKPKDLEPPEVPDNAILEIMRPVPRETTNLIYTHGRMPYLKKRYIVKPEDRYYLRETTGFHYGWKMWDHAKNDLSDFRCPKTELVRRNFYRRRAGIQRDPDWYKTPLRTNPTVCNAL